MINKLYKILGIKIITSYSSDGPITKHIQLPENNIICRLFGIITLEKQKKILDMKAVIIAFAADLVIGMVL